MSPYVDSDQSSILSVRPLFASDDPVLDKFLILADQKKESEAKTGELLTRFGSKVRKTRCRCAIAIQCVIIN